MSQPADPGPVRRGRRGDRARRERAPRSAGVRWTVRLLALVVVAVLALFVYQGTRAALALRQVRSDASQLTTQLSHDDVAGARRTLADVAVNGRTAHRSTDGVLWRIAGHTPFVGSDLRAVSVLSEVVDETATSSLPIALGLVDQVERTKLRSSTGQFQLAAISALTDPLSRLAATLREPQRQLSSLDAQQVLLPPIRKAVLEAQSKFATLTASADGGATATRLLPTMLGAHGPRTYLLVIQNNAEIRATGGLPGSMSTLTVRDGRISLGPQHSTAQYRTFPAPVVPLTAGELAIYGSTLSSDLRDSNLTPDFPRAATFMSTMYQRLFGPHVDGVIAVDPVALAGVLKATGPIRVFDSEMSSENAVSSLLSDVYARYPTDAEQNAYFASAAQQIFAALSSGRANQRELIQQLSQSAAQRRLLVWSRDPAQENAIATTPVGGALPRGGGAPQVGFYLNDGTARKIEYYLSYATSLSSDRCESGSRQTLTAGITLRSSVPANYLQLSPTVIGYGQYSPRGSMRVNVRIYAPSGGTLDSVTADGQKISTRTVDHDGRPVSVVGVLIGPGQKVSLTATFTSGAGQRADPQLEWTPSIVPGPSARTAASACD